MIALFTALAAASVARAAGWEMHDFETPLGDRGVSLMVPAIRVPDVHLALACDGDTGNRWRGVAVVEEPNSRVGLGMSGAVRVGFGENFARDNWAVRTTAAGRHVYTAPESTKLARRLASEDLKVTNARFTVEINGAGGRPVALTFPLEGLAAKIEKISERCDEWDIKP